MHETPGRPHYRRSSFCAKGSCVEVAPLPHGEIAVRDSKNPQLPPHIFTGDEWQAFLTGVKNGEFDSTTLA